MVQHGRSDCQLQETGTCRLKMCLFETEIIQRNSHVEARVALGLAERGSGNVVGSSGYEKAECLWR